jgi:hypothetical protein
MDPLRRIENLNIRPKAPHTPRDGQVLTIRRGAGRDGKQREPGETRPNGSKTLGDICRQSHYIYNEHNLLQP